MPLGTGARGPLRSRLGTRVVFGVPRLPVRSVSTFADDTRREVDPTGNTVLPHLFEQHSLL